VGALAKGITGSDSFAGGLLKGWTGGTQGLLNQQIQQEQEQAHLKNKLATEMLINSLQQEAQKTAEQATRQRLLALSQGLKQAYNKHLKPNGTFDHVGFMHDATTLSLQLGFTPDDIRKILQEYAQPQKQQKPSNKYFKVGNALVKVGPEGKAVPIYQQPTVPSQQAIQQNLEGKLNFAKQLIGSGRQYISTALSLIKNKYQGALLQLNEQDLENPQNREILTNFLIKQAKAGDQEAKKLLDYVLRGFKLMDTGVELYKQVGQAYNVDLSGERPSAFNVNPYLNLMQPNSNSTNATSANPYLELLKSK